MLRKNKYSLLQTKTAVISLYSLQASTHRHTTTPTSKQPKKSGSVSVSEHTPTPPLTKQQSTDNKLGLMLGWGGEGRGGCALGQMLTFIQKSFMSDPMVNYFNC